MPRFKGFCHHFNAHVCSKTARTTTWTLFLAHCVGRRICAQKEFCILHSTLQEFPPILLRFQDGKAIVVRINATFEDCLCFIGSTQTEMCQWNDSDVSPGPKLPNQMCFSALSGLKNAMVHSCCGKDGGLLSWRQHLAQPIAVDVWWN